jgi:hypothetical protein
MPLKKKINQLLIILPWLMVLPLVGCSSETGPKLVRVIGTITINGHPLGGAEITFLPMGSTPGDGSRGRTRADGTFRLVALKGGAGAVPGQYKVIISKLVLPDGSDFPANSEIPPIESSAREKLPQKYSDAQNTELTATVSSDGGTIDFRLQW